MTRSDDYHDPLTLFTTSKITKLEISNRLSFRSDSHQNASLASLPYVATERSENTESEILDGSSALSRRRQVALQMLCAGRRHLADLHYYLLLRST